MRQSQEKRLLHIGCRLRDVCKLYGCFVDLGEAIPVLLDDANFLLLRKAIANSQFETVKPLEVKQ